MEAFVLTLVRVSNAIRGQDKKAALNESLGRIYGWLSLIFNKPKHI